MRNTLAALTAFLMVGCAAVQTNAQTFDLRYQQAFAGRVGNPGDTSSLSAFVNVAVEAGQYDQALSTIEEHLITYPRDAKAHLIAARLYNHVGSRELAARHLEAALEIGSLDESDLRAAKRLLGSVERAMSGISGYLDLTAGVRSESIDFAPTAPWTDRTDTNAFFIATGQLRFDLETSTNDAIIVFGQAVSRRRFGDFDFNGVGGVYSAPYGRFGMTLDMGLPTELIPTLRGQVSVYGSYETFDADLYRRAYGAIARLTALPTANTFVYAEAGYAWLGDSASLLLEDHRLSYEAGVTWRIARSHSVGIAGRAYVDYLESFGEVGHQYEVELSYAGQVYAFSNGPVWSQQAGVAYGDVQVPNVVLGPAFPFFGEYWRTYWTHSLQINENNRIDFDLSYRESAYTNSPARDQSKLDVSLSYTVSLY